MRPKESEGRLLLKCRDELSHLSLIEKKDGNSLPSIVRQVRNEPEMDDIEKAYRKAHTDADNLRVAFDKGVVCRVGRAPGQTRL